MSKRFSTSYKHYGLCCEKGLAKRAEWEPTKNVLQKGKYILKALHHLITKADVFLAKLQVNSQLS
jgi:hypothetical protein